MKFIQKIFAFLAALSFIIILLITTTEGAIYLDDQYYQKEYEKYEVLDQLHMTMEDVMFVTDEMMEYLRGNREKLAVITNVDGKEQDFFNEQDRFHMEEVQNIFCGALKLRRISLGIFAVSIIILLALKADWKRLLSIQFITMTGLLAAIAGVLAFFMNRNFNQCFVIFHEIFFDNDLWMFDPETDYMIRMLPEGFFADFAIRIGIAAGIGLAVFLVISIGMYKIAKRQQEDRDLFLP